MKKICLIILFAISIAACAVGFSACNLLSEGHTHSFDEWVITKRATCTEDGERERYCSCGEKQVAVIGALGHDIINHEGLAATCTQDGYTAYVNCSRCDYATESEVIEALGHDIIIYNALSPYCTQHGHEEYEACSRCDYSTGVEIAPLGHDYGEWFVTVQPTCTTFGEEKRICSHNDGHFEIREIQPLGHSSTEWIIVKAATCEEDGEKQKICSDCHMVLETQTLPETGHDYAEWITTVQPTCTNDGEMTRVCKNNSNHIEFKSINATGHVYVGSYDEYNHFDECEICGEVIKVCPHEWDDNNCSVCGFDAGGIKGFDWLLKQDGNYELTGIGRATELVIEIPENYNGKLVTSVAANAFRDCGDITQIIVPDSILTIGFAAFFGCNSLNSLTLPFIGSSAESSENSYLGYIFGAQTADDSKLYVPTALQTVTLSDKLQSIPEKAFYKCHTLKYVILPHGLKSIGAEAFYCCFDLEEIEVPATVTELGYAAFFGCCTLETIVVPESVKVIGNYCFYGCTSLNCVSFENTVGWSLYNEEVKIDFDLSTIFQDEAVIASKLTDFTYCTYIWKCE